MVIINKIPLGNIENFVRRLHGERVKFTDDGVRKIICAKCYYEGIRIEVVKEEKQAA